MKWTKFIILLVVFMLTIKGIDRLYAPIDTWADTMLKAYSQRKDSVDVIIIGHSHTGAIRQSRLGDLNVMNFSYAGMELKDRYDFLKEILKQKGRVRYVVMAMDYDQIGHKTSDGMVHNMLLPCIVNNESGLTSAVSKMEPTNFLRHNRDLKVLYEYYVTRRYNRNDTSFVPLNFTNKNDFSACSKRALELSKLNYSSHNINENLELLDEIHKLLNEKGIMLVLLNTPKPSCFNEVYFNNLDTSHMFQLRDYISRNHLMYADFGKANCFNGEDFRDFDHLSDKGSKLVCDSIWRMIESRQELAKN
ncbi:MAG: hypothetical protein ACJ75B_19205 [Flavisolibacter sp.]